MFTALVAPTIWAAIGVTGASIVTLGNQERQDITAANQWVEGNIDFWLEGHLYDAVVRWDAGTTTATLPNTVDFSYSFFFPAQNATVVDWVQDWRVTLDPTKMFHTKSDSTVSGPFTCPVPPFIISIPKGGTSIMMPEFGSICAISPPLAPTTSSPATGWADLTALSASDFAAALPKRNEACPTIDSTTGLCSGAGLDSQASPAGEHFFRLSLSSLFGAGGPFASAYTAATGGTFPSLPANKHFELYFRAHLSLTAIWQTGSEASQPQFCSTLLNTVNRCSGPTWTAAHLGSGFSPGSKNHGTVNCLGCGSKTIPLPQVVAPTGFITVCKIVTNVETDQTGASGTLTNGWVMTVTSPIGFSLTKTTGSDGLGCSKFGPFFPSPDYQVKETLQAGFFNIGTVVSPAADRDPAFGANPSPSNPVNVTLTFAEASTTPGTGPKVTFINFKPTIGISVTCNVQIKDASGAVVSRDAIAGDTVTFTYTVTNTGGTSITVTETHTNTVRLGPNPLFTGTLAVGTSNTVTRSTTIVKGDLGTVSDTVMATGMNAFGQTATDSHTCSFIIRAPNISFTKHPVASDNKIVVPGETFPYTITVTNSGDAPATVTVTDALGAGQTFLIAGASPTPASPSADTPAPVTVTFSGLTVGPSTTITITFNVLVTANANGTLLTGLMTLTAVNANGVDYSPSPNTAANLVEVERSILKLSAFGYTNTPKLPVSSGIVSGTTVYTATFHNFGSKTASLSGSLVVTNTASSGTVTCGPSSGGTLVGCTLSWSAVSLAPGADFTVSLTVTYDSLNSGAKVIADLTTSYTTPPSSQTFIASGTPAEISFTVQSP